MRSLWLVGLLTCSVLMRGQSAPILNKIGNAVKNFGSKMFGKLTGIQMPPGGMPSLDGMPGMPGMPDMSNMPEVGKDANINKQLQFLNNMLTQAETMMGNSVPGLNSQMAPITKMMVEQVIPQFKRLDFTDDQLRMGHNMDDAQIRKFRELFTDTKMKLERITEKMKQ